jgi:hypothetical protein
MLDSAGRLISGPGDRTDDLFDAFSITCKTAVPPYVLVSTNNTKDQRIAKRIAIGALGRKLIGEAQRNGIIGAEEAANLAASPTLPRREPGWGTGSRETRLKSY